MMGLHRVRKKPRSVACDVQTFIHQPVQRIGRLMHVPQVADRNRQNW